MDDYDKAEEGKARFEKLIAASSNVLGGAGFLALFLMENYEDDEAQAVCNELFEINQQMGDIHERICNLETRIY